MPIKIERGPGGLPSVADAQEALRTRAFIDVATLAAATEQAPRVIRDAIRAGDIQVVRLGRSVRIPTAPLPRRTPATASRWAIASAPWLLKPIRLTIARLSGSRNSRGRSLPGWACAVTVPSSAKPNPSAAQAATATPFLSSPAATPTWPGKSMPATLTPRR